MLWLGPELQVSLLGTELPHTPVVGEAEVKILVNAMLSWACPEWGIFVEDPTEDVVVEKLGISIKALYQDLNIPYSSAPFALRNALDGTTTHQGLRRRFGELVAKSPKEELRQLQGSLEAYEQIMVTNPVSLVGQIGAPVYWPQRRGIEGFQLADGVMKAVIYHLVGNGFRLAAVFGNAFLLEIPEGSEATPPHVEGIVDIVNEAAKRLIGDVAHGCCVCHPSNRW